MQLDKRIIKGKRPLTCLETDEAEAFIGKECYFSDDLSSFVNMSDKNMKYKGTLLKVWNDGTDPYETNKHEFYAYCLPCEWVTKEKKYRPFTLNEFLHLYELGDVVTLKCKYNDHKYAGIVTGYETDKDGEKAIMHIGCYSYLLSVLFTDYERYDTDKWVPFGMEVEE